EDQGWRWADRRFRTVDQPVKDVWDFLTSTEGTGLWLGQRGSRSYVATARMRRSSFGAPAAGRPDRRMSTRTVRSGPRSKDALWQHPDAYWLPEQRERGLKPF